jgi:hypothetical protein
MTPVPSNLPPTVQPAPPATAHASGPFFGKGTWLCTFTVLADMPTTMDIADMEGLIAGGLATALLNLGLPGNVSAQLTATAGSASVTNPTQPAVVVPTLPTVPPV